MIPTTGSVKAFDFDANRDAVLKADLARFRILHFATHSFFDDERPDLSGIVLSMVDRSGRRRNGFLRLYDIYNLRLNADLVVLSACRTALGKEIRGEGLVGLTRGFFYAGAPRVLASLWQVDDRTGAALMAPVYEAILVRHDTPAAALRSAQIAIWRTKGWDAPYYWGAFVMQGEWK
jgi:CHAT domain-containing protein